MFKYLQKFAVLLIIVYLLGSALASEKNPDNCEKCGPTRMIGCRNGRCYYKCIRRCLGTDSKFYYEALKFNFAGQR